MEIEITPPKFDLHGFYEFRVREIVHANLPEKQKVTALKALIEQAYRQGKYDARILTKDPNKWNKQ